MRLGTAAFDFSLREAGIDGAVPVGVLRRVGAAEAEGDLGLRVRVGGFSATLVAARVAFGRETFAAFADVDFVFAGAEAFGVVRGLGRGGETSVDALAGTGPGRGVREEAAGVARGAERRFCGFMGQALPPEGDPGRRQVGVPGGSVQPFCRDTPVDASCGEGILDSSDGTS